MAVAPLFLERPQGDFNWDSLLKQPDMKPGAYEVYAPDGNVITNVPAAKVQYESEMVNVTTALQISVQQKLIADFHQTEKLIQYLENNQQRPVVSAVRLDNATFNPAVARDEQYYAALNQKRLDFLSLLGDDIEDQNAADREVAENVKELSQNSTFSFNSILDEIINSGLDFVLGKINDVLPPGYELGASFENGEFTGVSIGGVDYDPRTGTFSAGGSDSPLGVVSALVSPALGYLNKFLPSFLQVGVSAAGISVGGTTVRFVDLAAGNLVPVVGNIAVGIISNTVIVSINGKQIPILGTNPLESPEEFLKSIGQLGVDALNEFLGVEDLVSVQYREGSNSPVVGVGPLLIDFQLGEVVVTPDAARQVGDNLLNEFVYNRLPGPLGNIVQSLWRAIPFESIFADIFPNSFNVTGVPPAPPDPKNTLAIDNKGVPATPRMVSSPAGSGVSLDSAARAVSPP